MASFFDTLENIQGFARRKAERAPALEPIKQAQRFAQARTSARVKTEANRPTTQREGPPKITSTGRTGTVETKFARDVGPAVTQFRETLAATPLPQGPQPLGGAGAFSAFIPALQQRQVVLQPGQFVARALLHALRHVEMLASDGNIHRALPSVCAFDARGGFLASQSDSKATPPHQQPGIL